jgi:hypothetical protein
MIYGMEFLKIISGLIFLTLGRRLFWLFIALMGFLIGMQLAGLIFLDQPYWLILLVALGAGLLGALIAVFAQRIAFALAAFIAGSYFAVVAAQFFGVYSAPEFFFFVGGIAGALLSVLFMDWTIIALSCFVGAGVIVDVLGLGQMPSIIVFTVLAVAGFFIQTRQINRSAKA